METLGSYAAKTRFSELLERVAGGEEITITKHGVPVARLVPANGIGSEERRAAIEELRGFRKGRSLRQSSIRELIDEGRRH